MSSLPNSNRWSSSCWDVARIAGGHLPNEVLLDLYQEFRQQGEDDPEPIQDDVVFEIELIKQVEINVDYNPDVGGEISSGTR